MKRCNPGQNLCELRSLSGNIDQRGCSNLSEFPEEYEAVNGDSNKRCKNGKAEGQKDCLCDIDLCNVRPPSPSLSPRSSLVKLSSSSQSSNIASITTSVASIIIAKVIFM